MGKPRTYLVDGKPYTAWELIDLARTFGYEGEDGVFFTSRAARHLRETMGTTVEPQPITTPVEVVCENFEPPIEESE